MKHFLVGGWDRKVTYYQDDGSREAPPGRCLKGHAGDIVDMAIMDSLPVLCVACDDGELWSWNLDSGERTMDE